MPGVQLPVCLTVPKDSGDACRDCWLLLPDGIGQLCSLLAPVLRFELQDAFIFVENLAETNLINCG